MFVITKSYQRTKVKSCYYVSNKIRKFNFFSKREDLRKAVDSVHKLGSDFKIIRMGERRVICSVSVELNDDHMAILKFAEENGGSLTYS